jgi:hypothetical protein
MQQISSVTTPGLLLYQPSRLQRPTPLSNHGPSRGSASVKLATAFSETEKAPSAPEAGWKPFIRG